MTEPGSQWHPDMATERLRHRYKLASGEQIQTPKKSVDTTNYRVDPSPRFIYHIWASGLPYGDPLVFVFAGP